MKAKVLQCEISRETNSSNSYPYYQEPYNTTTRKIHELGNLSKSSSVKEKEIYPNED